MAVLNWHLPETLAQIEGACAEESAMLIQSLACLLKTDQARLLLILNQGLRTLNMHFVDCVAQILLPHLEIAATDESSAVAKQFAKTLRKHL